MALPSTTSAQDFNWTGGIALIGYHLLLLITLPIYLIYVPLKVGLILAAIVLYLLAGLGITAGYHRFYSHRTYQPHKFLEAVLLILGTLAVQGSVLRWAHDHRKHHRFVDTDKDPYQTKDGFWHSHLLWMFKKQEPLEEQRVGDLMSNSLVQLQDRYYGIWVLIVNAVPVVLDGWLFSDYTGAVVIALLARMFVVHHSTWFINSLAHMWGSKPYSTEHSAVNNWVLALLTMGEGYHNYHHTFAGDYRNGVRFYQYDITKAFIWLASKLGLASGLRKTENTTIKKKLIREDRRWMLEKIRDGYEPARVKLEEEIVSISEKVVALLNEGEKLKNHLASLKNSNSDADLVKNLRRELSNLRKNIRRESRSWARLCRQIAKTPAFGS